MGPTTFTVLPSASFLALFVACVAVAGVDVNRTIDDQKGDSVTGVAPLFLPTDLWNIGQTCTSCVIRAGSPIDPGQVFDGTWHDATHYGDSDPDRIVQVSFTGHAIYVYHTIMNILVHGASTRTNLTFLIDSEFVGNYLHNPTSNDSTPAVFYQMLVYSNDALEQGEHTLQVVASGGSTVLVLFDYVMYTTVEDDGPEPPPSSQSPPPELFFPASHSLLGTTSFNAGHDCFDTFLYRSTGLFAVFSNRIVQCLSFPGVNGFDGHPVRTDFTVAIATITTVRCALDITGPSEYSYRGYLYRCRVRRRLWSGRVGTESQPELQQIIDKDAPPTLPSKESPVLDVSDRVHVSWRPPPAGTHPEPESGGTPLGVSQTERLALLAQHIQTLQAQVNEMRSLRMEERKDGRDSWQASATETSLSTMLAALREEMAELRAELREQQYGYPHGIPPSYGS
ncbi:hypothetical protein ONZ51_g6086 [Trametes cubensis]|uniref:Uncharacterized protein n=1 Tax=Trametes cubensis TaxID=1111947 RepID=A0AAD7TVB8_9APHY|nr:hypothetical protein ONZ51_g6086 [Trametes cubensis]